MMSGLPILIFAAAQAGGAAPVGSPTAQTAQETCSPADPTDSPDSEIVICVERSDGYRIDPDVMEAERQSSRKKLKRPERLADTSCASVGPFGCRGGGGIDLLAAAVVAATMAKRAVEGENVGEMLVTEPQPDEYKLYLEAKRKRAAEKTAKAESTLVPAE